MQIEKDDTLVVQIGYKSGKYKTRWSFTNEPNKAAFYYQGLNVGYGYKKRLVLHRQGSKPITLARMFS